MSTTSRSVLEKLLLTRQLSVLCKPQPRVADLLGHERHGRPVGHREGRLVIKQDSAFRQRRFTVEQLVSNAALKFPINSHQFSRIPAFKDKNHRLSR